jgi:polyisoprenoid-binding protein YceI
VSAAQSTLAAPRRGRRQPRRLDDVVRPLKWIIGAVVALAVAVSAGVFVYIHFIEGPAPARLSLSQVPSSDASATATTIAGSTATTAVAGPVPSGGVDGSWSPTTDSQVGYRVKETLFGQKNEAVGRTNKVTGTVTISGTTVSTADLTVDMKSVKSSESQRDGQFNGRIMNTSTFPTATFKLTQSVQLPSVPTDATPITVKATGVLTLHGVTKTVSFDIRAQRTGSNLAINSTIPITFADYNIDNPSGGPASTEDHGELELLIVLAKH